MQIQLKLQELSIKYLSQLGSWDAFNWIGKDKLCQQGQGRVIWLLVFGKIILMVLTTRDTEESQNNLMAVFFVWSNRWYYLHCEVGRRLLSMCYDLKISYQGKYLCNTSKIFLPESKAMIASVKRKVLLGRNNMQSHSSPWTSNLI